MNNHRFQKTWPQKFCRCGELILSKKKPTPIRHILSCFFGGHSYIFLGTRDDHDEYMCTRCGHPLLFRKEENIFAEKGQFRKRVRYLCGLFGHKVHLVTHRQTFWEYACFCGHSFLKKKGNLQKITHPLLCIFTGHSVEQIGDRSNCSELLCIDCGHTFLLGLHIPNSEAAPHTRYTLSQDELRRGRYRHRPEWIERSY
jgi:hypothetical protein